MLQSINSHYGNWKLIRKMGNMHLLSPSTVFQYCEIHSTSQHKFKGHSVQQLVRVGDNIIRSCLGMVTVFDCNISRF
jgi:hypothetical protein